MSASVDWDVLNIEGVMEVAEKAAASVAGEYNLTEAEDLLQEAYIFLASRANLKEAAESDQLGLLYHRLRQDLVDLERVQARGSNRQTSYEAAREGAE